MQIGYLGLGKMGTNMVTRLLEKKIEVVAWNRSPEPRKEIAKKKGATVTETVEQLISKLSSPRIIWLMLPAGKAVGDMVGQLANLLSKNDIVIDGGNSLYLESQKHAVLLAKKSIKFIDVGVSGGPAGARNGACLMIGGEKSDILALRELWEAIAAPGAYGRVGGIGAGHFAKMVHNGIEYGMMEAIGEGASVLQCSPFQYDLAEIFRLYNNRSVIMSRLVGWVEEAFAENKTLSGVSSTIAASGEGQWTVEEAKKLGVPVPVIEASLAVRSNSANDTEDSPEGFRNKVVSVLREKFGGHKVRI